VQLLFGTSNGRVEAVGLDEDTLAQGVAVLQADAQTDFAGLERVPGCVVAGGMMEAAGGLWWCMGHGRGSGAGASTPAAALVCCAVGHPMPAASRCEPSACCLLSAAWPCSSRRWGVVCLLRVLDRPSSKSTSMWLECAPAVTCPHLWLSVERSAAGRRSLTAPNPARDHPLQTLHAVRMQDANLRVWDVTRPDAAVFKAKNVSWTAEGGFLARPAPTLPTLERPPCLPCLP
jgi:hypothetical protein